MNIHIYFLNDNYMKNIANRIFLNDNSKFTAIL
jgi:hypothetical protein